MERSEIRDLPTPDTKTRIALCSVRATLAFALDELLADELTGIVFTPNSIRVR
jgi:hypothetical protein